MDEPRILGIIPARLASERLPRKPLVELAGRPLIEWVWRRVRSMPVLDRVVVATDADEVAAACVAAGAEVVLSSSEHRSGTERAAEVASRQEYADFDVVVNVQGDEPFMTPEAVSTAAGFAAGEWDIGTVATPVADAQEWRDPAVVKVVRGDEGRALYFSRAPIPSPRDGEPPPDALRSGRYLRHLGVYAYTAAALRRWAALPPDELEMIERLEQLRPLAAGLGIGVGVVPSVEPGVDTPDDVRRAERRLAEMQQQDPSRFSET